MSVHQPIFPAKAIELVKSRDLEKADALLADFAAAGLIKTYALVREIRPTGGPTKVVRDAQIPAQDWERIVASKKIQAALGLFRQRLNVGNWGGERNVCLSGLRLLHRRVDLTLASTGSPYLAYRNAMRMNSSANDASDRILSAPAL